MGACALGLRGGGLGACDGGDPTRQEVADDFVGSRSFVQKLRRRRADGVPLAARPRSGGAAPVLSEQDLGRLRGLVGEKPDRTLAELRSALHESGGPEVSVPTVCRALKKLGLPLKKRPCTPASGTRRGSGGGAGGGRAGRSRAPAQSRGSGAGAGGTRDRNAPGRAEPGGRERGGRAAAGAFPSAPATAARGWSGEGGFCVH